MNAKELSELFSGDDVLCMIQDKVESLGSQKAAAKYFGISEQYLSDVLAKNRPIPEACSDKLMLVKFVCWRAK